MKKNAKQLNMNIFDRFPNPIMITNRDSTLIYINSALEKLTGYSAGEVINTKAPYPWWQEADKIAGIRQFPNDIIAKDWESRKQELTFVKKNGQSFMIETTYIFNEAKDLFISSWNDVTDRKIAQQLLRESEQKYKILVENSNVGIFIMQDWKFVFVNNYLAELLGYTREEMIGMEYMVTIHPEDSEIVRNNIVKGLTWGPPMTRRGVRRIRKDGQVIWTEVRANTIEHMGKPAIMGNVYDMNELYQSEQKLKESEEKYRNVVENSLIGIFIHQDSKYVFVNDVFARMHGYEPDEMIGMDFTKLLHPDYIEGAQKQILKRLAGEVATTPNEFRRLRKNGEVFWVQAMTTTADYEGGLAVLGNMINITDRKKLEMELKKSEERYKALVESSLTGIIIVQDERYVFVNKQYASMLGYKPEELLGMDYLSSFHPDEREIIKRAISARFPLNVGEPRIARRLCKDGRIIITETIAHTIEYEGKPTLMASILDITDRYKMEQKLKESEEKYRNVVENSLMGIFIHQNGTLIFVNNKLANMHGYEPAELLGTSYLNLLHPDYRELAMNRVEPIEEYSQNSLFKGLKKNGEVFWGQVIATFIEINGLPAVLGNVLDITDRHKMEQRLKESEEKYKNVVESSLIGIFIHQDRIIVFANKTFAHMHGYEPEELLGTNYLSLLHPDYRTMVQPVVAPVEGYTQNTIFKGLKKNGEIFWCQVMIMNIEINGVLAVMTNVLDITDKRRLQQELELRAELLNMATDSIFLTDKNGKILFANDTACKVHGYELSELMNMNILDLNTEAEELRDRILELWKKGNMVFNTVHRNKSGAAIPMEVHSRIITVDDQEMLLSTARDVTERKGMEQQLIIADRMASLGNLAMGFSHELNNPLTSVIGYSQLLLRNKDLTDNVRKDIENIHGQAQRTAGIIRNFTDFAKSSTGVKQPVDFNGIITKVLDLRKYELQKQNINVVTHLEADLPPLLIDVGQMQQVLLNLVMNAEHFMNEAHKQGNLTIITDQTDGIVKASFIDDGPGIEPGRLEHIFDPFYTTREVGSGPGLGLTIGYRIITEHGGKLYAQSELGKGSTFIIELPISKADD